MDRLIICGGGHVSLELAYLAARLDFEVIVLDDRVEFANVVRFPTAQQVLCAPFAQSLTRLGSTADDFFVIVTRGHAFDRDCLAQVLGGKYAYVGMIGSRGKVAAVMQSLQTQGIPSAVLDTVHAPIGLPIGGQTPAEIAVSIGAQLVQVRCARAPSTTLPPTDAGILVTIVDKRGSAPRGVGAWMLVLPDGGIIGTIGGGAVEHQATVDALALWTHKESFTRKTYDLSPDAADLGMVCGGKIDVKFEVRP